MTVTGMSSSSGLSILQAYDSDSESVTSADGNDDGSSSKKCDSKRFSKRSSERDDVPSKRPRISQSDDSSTSEDEVPKSCMSGRKSRPETKEPAVSRPDHSLRLPSVPINILQMFPEAEGKPEDDPTQHDGRIRSFPHVRGNWASYIYIQCPESATAITELNKLICDAGKSLLENLSLHLINDKHLSLSRTLPFRHHWIDPFTSKLKKLIASHQSFDLCFDKFDVYTNDDKSRTFVSMKAISSQHLIDMVEKCDESLADFQLEPYYKDPSFHISCAWILGDQSLWAKQNLIPILNQKWSESTESDPDIPFFHVSSVEFKTGNKLYRFFLRK